MAPAADIVNPGGSVPLASAKAVGGVKYGRPKSLPTKSESWMAASGTKNRAGLKPDSIASIDVGVLGRAIGRGSLSWWWPL